MASNLSTRLTWDLAQTRWASILNPIIALTIIQGQQIDNILMTANKPLAINHSLGQAPVGWFKVDSDANGNVWRTQPFNKNTITLESSATQTISIWIY